MEFQLSYFKSWKMMLWKCCTQYASKFGKLSSGHRTGKGQFSFQSPKTGNAKVCSNYHTIPLISHTSKVMLKILQTRLQQYVNHKLPDVQAGFRKGRGNRDQIANIWWIIDSLCLIPAQAGINIAGEISITSNIQTTAHYGIKWRRTKEPLDESERGEW